MKRLLSLAVSLFVCLSVYAEGYVINDIRISVGLRADGSASFTEIWDVVAERGTEWYLVKGNLGDIEISGFRVSENGVDFRNEGHWKVEADRGAKAGKCGILDKGSHLELCWGIGDYGHHVFTVHYDMSNVVKSLTDYDMMHIQLVSPGLSARPEHVSVNITAPVPLSVENSRIWGFGYVGTADYDNGGGVLMESSERFRGESSVISLMRFDKGIFSSESVRDCRFDTVLDEALAGTSFADDAAEEEAEGVLYSILSGLAIFVLCVFAAVRTEKARRKRILGCRPKDVPWCREIPFKGDVLQANRVLYELDGKDSKSNVASALVLRMIMDGQISVGKDSRDRTELHFNDGASLDSLPECGRELLAMMREASGKDLILQKNEFRKWSRRHSSRLVEWNDSMLLEAARRAADCGNMSGGRFTVQGQAEARRTLGFRKYLKDFTLVEERNAQEVVLWKDYLVFASLYGIADKVAKELREINPQAFDEIVSYDYTTLNQVLYLSRVMADSITDARTAAMETGASRGGYGGFSSFGGGGGFSGGGFGGGGR